MATGRQAQPSPPLGSGRLADLSASPMVLTDPDGRVTWVNRAFETLTGYSSAEVLGRTPGSLLQCPETDTETILAIRAALAARLPITVPILNRSKSGRLYWLSLEIQPMIDAQGLLEGFQAIETDVTDIVEGPKLEARALAKSQDAIMSAVADLVEVGALELDLESSRIAWSPQARRIFDLEPDFESTLAEAMVFLSVEGRALLEAAITRAVEGRQVFEFEHGATTALGRAIWIRAVGQCLFVDDAPLKLICALKDVTRERAERETLRVALLEANNALASLSAYQEAVDRYGIVAITDRKGDIIFVNDRFCEISGYSREELMGRNHRILNSGHHPRKFFVDMWRSIARGRPWHAEVCNRDKAGNLYWVDTTVVPLLGADGRPERFVSVRYDITERKTSDARQLALVEELSERSLAAEAASVAKGQFLATMSHELRTPMSGVIGMLDLLMINGLTDEQAERASTALGSARQLLVILNDILDFSKLEMGQVMIEVIPFNTGQLIRELHLLFGGWAVDKGLRLSWDVAPDVPHWLTGDPTRIRQVLINLVGNALKFTEGGEVVVHMSHDPDRLGGELRFEVRDTGIGLSEDAQRQIFQRFVQGDASMSRRFGGTGLGLAISKELVELMNGDIGVRSQEGCGSTFWFTVEAPVSDAPESELHEQDARSSVSECLRILVADDHPVNRMIVEAYLTLAGHEVVLADDGAQAVQAVKDEAFDLVLMDIHMPVMDGLTATRIIRALPHPLCDIPIVALTANAMAGDRDRYLGEGMNGYVAKPVDRRLLLEAVLRSVSGDTASKTPA